MVWESLGSGSDLLGINHNRKGGAFEIEQPKVGPKGETSGSERVKGHGEEEEVLRYVLRSGKKGNFFLALKYFSVFSVSSVVKLFMRL